MYMCTPVWESEENTLYDRMLIIWQRLRGTQFFHCMKINKKTIFLTTVQNVTKHQTPLKFTRGFLSYFSVKLFMSNWAHGWVWHVFVCACDLHKRWCNIKKWKNSSSGATSPIDQGWCDFTRNTPNAKLYVSTVGTFQNRWLWLGIIANEIQRENSGVFLFSFGFFCLCWFFSIPYTDLNSCKTDIGYARFLYEKV